MRSKYSQIISNIASMVTAGQIAFLLEERQCLRDEQVQSEKIF